MKLTKKIAEKVLTTVDAGLSSGLGQPVPGQMCIEAAVCFALGLPHGDDPGCVGHAVRSFKISLNDSDWSSSAARAKGMRKIAIAQLGSDTIDQQKFSELLVLKTIQKLCPLLFHELAKIATKDGDKLAMEAAAVACETAVGLPEVVEILKNALDLARALDLDLALALALDRARARALALDLALDLARARALALDLARARALALALALDLALALARARARARALALDLARARDLALDLARDLDLALDLARDLDLALDLARARALDQALTLMADICLECLVELGSPGCEWLSLCDVVDGSEKKEGAADV